VTNQGCPLGADERLDGLKIEIAARVGNERVLRLGVETRPRGGVVGFPCSRR